MEQLVTSDFKLGIIAGGQLGKMTALAASNWDIKTYILDKESDCPASSVCSAFIKGDPSVYADVYNFGKQVDMLTYEIESINISALKDLQKAGVKIYPQPEALEIIQDKGLQKQFYTTHGIPSPEFTLYKSREEVLHAVESKTLKTPFVQKLRKGGYDGKGVAVIKNETDLSDLLSGECIIEKKVEIKKEISVIVARNANNEIVCFDPVEMEFNSKANLVEMLVCPAQINEDQRSKAIEIASRLISSLNFCGLLAVEMFLDTEDMLWVNECAPRPHNSGHHTIESTITSQYEQLLRAIFNFPLGSTKIKMPSVMLNLLGENGYNGPVKYEGVTDCMGIEGVKIHFYGKKITKPFRKMGHVTILAQTIEEAKEKANKVKQKLKVKA